MLVFPQALRHAATTATDCETTVGRTRTRIRSPGMPNAYCDTAHDVAGLLNDDDIYPIEESAMDLIYLAIVVIVFAATAVLVYGCERLGRSA
ncbi:MAG: hypothetical protein ACT4QB_09780 [Gammaproteobacteria bacterium]